MIIIWFCFLLSLIAFIIFISIASTYSVINCTNAYVCENGLSMTPDYHSRKKYLSAANICSWIVLGLYVLGVVLSDLIKT